MPCLALATRLRPCHENSVVSYTGVFSRACSSFFFRWFWFFSRVRWFPSRCWFGVGWRLLFLVFAFFLRSFSGSVLWCCFVSRAAASAFALSCSRLVGFAVCVRRACLFCLWLCVFCLHLLVTDGLFFYADLLLVCRDRTKKGGRTPN